MSDALARLPLLSGSDAEQADLTVTALAQAYGALQAGKMPTTEQVVSGVRKILNSSLLQPDVARQVANKVGGGKLSKRGRNFVVAERRVLEALARLALEKNDDDKIQQFLWDARHAGIDDVSVDGELSVRLPRPPVPSTDELKDSAHSLHELMSALLTSKEIRYILSDSVNLFRVIFADALDELAEGEVAAIRATKKAARDVRPTDEQIKQHNAGIEDRFGAEHWEDVVGNLQDARKQVRRGYEDKRDDTLRKGVKKGRALVHYVDEKLPTDTKDAVIERFRRVVGEIQSKPEYQDAVNTLSHLARKYFNLARDELEKTAEQSKAKLDKLEVEPDDEAKDAVTQLRRIIESFTGPLEPALQAASALHQDLKGDEKVQQVWHEFDVLLDRAINDPGYITTSKASRRFENIYDRARAIVESNADWKRDAKAFVDEASKLLDHAANDQALVAVGDAFEDLGDAVAEFAKTGYNLVGVDGGDLWKDLSTVFLPRLLGSLKSIPLPRVEFTSEDVDLIIDNIKFESASFVPDAAHFKSNIEFSTKKGYAAYASEFATTTTLVFAGLRMAATDISYYVHKKTGWIGIEDSGLLDVTLGNPHDSKAHDGLDVTLVLSNATEGDRESFFKLEKVDVQLEGFDARIRQSNHPVRAWFASGALRVFLEAKIKEVLEDQFSEAFKALDKQLYLLHYKSLGAYGAAPNPLAYVRGLLNTGASSSSLYDEVTSTGIRKVGPKGEWVLSVGVEEELLPGKRTLLGRKGEDIVGRKRSTEALLEEGRNELVGAAREAGVSVDSLRGEAYEVGDALDEAVDSETRNARKAASRRKREEVRKDGWKSDAFDLAA
ncbi:uncharacterized protein JCM10292_004655 [Rhodotorula paludigena]|uniref:uncharacterized protein n=1 Tax=Rhodotorula paludigena TaxID=86838 RepID=UPI003182B836